MTDESKRSRTGRVRRPRLIIHAWARLSTVEPSAPNEPPSYVATVMVGESCVGYGVGDQPCSALLASIRDACSNLGDADLVVSSQEQPGTTKPVRDDAKASAERIANYWGAHR